MAYIDDSVVLSETIESLRLEVSTVDAGDAASDNWLFANVVFTDGTRLYGPYNQILLTPPSPGNAKTFNLSLPEGVKQRPLSDIGEFYLRKMGSGGWFLGSALLFVNNHALPLLGNRHANQFLDNDDDVLDLREWSTASFCVAPRNDADEPLPRSGYRLLGPVIGQLSDTSAVVLYRVDREGNYHFLVREASSGTVVFDQTTAVEPTARFEISNLEPDQVYEFELLFVRGGVETAVSDGAGSFRTFPPENSPGRFAFAFGSCINPDKQRSQGVWTAKRGWRRVTMSLLESSYYLLTITSKEKHYEESNAFH